MQPEVISSQEEDEYDRFFNAPVKLSDLIAGVLASVIALLYLAPESSWQGQKIALIIAGIVGLGSGWYMSRQRHWIMKIFLYAGMMVLCIFVADLLPRLFFMVTD